MKYSQLANLVSLSHLDLSDLNDLVSILREEDAVVELNKIKGGDRIDYIKWLLDIILNPSPELKLEAEDLKKKMKQSEMEFYWAIEEELHERFEHWVNLYLNSLNNRSKEQVREDIKNLCEYLNNV